MRCCLTKILKPNRMKEKYTKVRKANRIHRNRGLDMKADIQGISDKMRSVNQQVQSELYYLELFGNLAKIQPVDNKSECIHIKEKGRVGKITVHHVFPGIDLEFSDIQGYKRAHNHRGKTTIEIRHCLQGRFECCYGDKKFYYLKEGDLSIMSQEFQAKEQCFPSENYYGASISIHLEEIPLEMHSIFNIFHINLKLLNQKLCSRKQCYIIQEDKHIKHIFEEIYSISSKRMNGYYKIKVLELLLILCEINYEEKDDVKSCFSHKQVETIKNIHDFMIEHVKEHYTLEQLSKYFAISLTLMKKCFKEVYGDSVYAYMKQYRLQIARNLLDSTSLSIAEIGEEIGYSNSNKFTIAFRDEYGMTPSQYRKDTRV